MEINRGNEEVMCCENSKLSSSNWASEVEYYNGREKNWASQRSIDNR